MSCYFSQCASHYCINTEVYLSFIYASSVSLIVYASHKCHMQGRSFSALHSVSFQIYHKPLRPLNNTMVLFIHSNLLIKVDLVNEFIHLVVSARHCLLLQLTNQISQQRRWSTICTHYECSMHNHLLFGLKLKYAYMYLLIVVRTGTCTTITCKTQRTCH